MPPRKKVVSKGPRGGGGGDGGETSQPRTTRKRDTPPEPEYNTSNFLNRTTFNRFNALEDANLGRESVVEYDVSFEEFGPVREFFDYQGWMPFINLDTNIHGTFVRNFYANFHIDENNECHTFFGGQIYDVNEEAIANLFNPPLPIHGLRINRNDKLVYTAEKREAISNLMCNHPHCFFTKFTTDLRPNVRIIAKIVSQSIYCKQGESGALRDFVRKLTIPIIQHKLVNLPYVLLEEMKDVNRKKSPPTLRLGMLITLFAYKWGVKISEPKTPPTLPINSGSLNLMRLSKEPTPFVPKSKRRPVPASTAPSSSAPPSGQEESPDASQSDRDARMYQRLTTYVDARFQHISENIQGQLAHDRVHDRAYHQNAYSRIFDALHISPYPDPSYPSYAWTTAPPIPPYEDVAAEDAAAEDAAGAGDDDDDDDDGDDGDDDYDDEE